jgi:hypothetical protein
LRLAFFTAEMPLSLEADVWLTNFQCRNDSTNADLLAHSAVKLCKCGGQETFIATMAGLSSATQVGGQRMQAQT